MNPTASNSTLGKLYVAAALQEIGILLELKSGHYLAIEFQLVQPLITG